jgi:protein farnesyltransferase/geranylgeranyltransferase type-1 subunit alpha
MVRTPKRNVVVNDRAYRAKILFALNEDLADELSFIEDIAEENEKNYQLYHHRQRIVEEMSQRGTIDFSRELAFTQELIYADHKNYHVWSYRYSPSNTV